MLCLGISNIVFSPNDLTAAAITSQMADFTHWILQASLDGLDLGASSLQPVCIHAAASDRDHLGYLECLVR